MSLTPAQISALSELEGVWPNRDVVVIGATAWGFYYDMDWRKTADVDLVVAVEIDEFPGRLAERPGWRQHPDKEHEFQSPQGIKLDFLPAGEALLRKGTIVWRRGQVMSLVGLDVERITEEPHRQLVETFLSRARDPDRIDHAQMQRRGPSRWSTEGQPLQRRIQAFRAGLVAGVPPAR